MWLKQVLKPWFLISTILFCLAVAFAAIGLTGTPTWKKMLRAEGYPLTMKELDEFYTAVPSKENAAPIYIQACVAMKELGTEESRLLPDLRNGALDVPSETISSDEFRVMGYYLDKNCEALRLVYEAAAYAKCRYPVYLASVPMYYHFRYSRLETLSRLLVIEGLFHLFQGDSPKAVDAMETHHALLHSLDSATPNEFWRLRRYRVQEHMGICVKEILKRDQLVESDWQRLQALYAPLEKTPERLRRSMMGDAALNISFGASYIFFPHSLDTFRYLFLNRVAGHERLRNIITTHRIREKNEALERPIRQLENIREEEKYEGLSLLILGVYWRLGPSWDLSASFLGREMIQHNLIRTAIALERYRVAVGRLPKRLQSLTPDYLEAVPTDYWVDAPLKYQRTDNGYLLYSVGENRKDDGGVEKFTEEKDDIVLSVERSA